MNISIVGLGYVGLPLAIQFARSGATVVGLDVDPVKVELINKGQSYIKHIPSDTIEAELRSKRLSASTDFGVIKGAAAVTSTLVATVDICIVKVRAIGTEPRTSTSSVLGAKPGAVRTS